ncbi:MAG: hypothetical protein QOI48_501 [Solirubrobacteraceae bacterium]|jgi:hypothetical protein|nr:hypothetical protein [Solirubrobacteraceae bacterium]
MAYCDETAEVLAAILRPGNAGSNAAGDHVAVVEHALAQVPAELIETIEILVPPIRRARRTSSSTSVASAACASRPAMN